MGSPARVLVVDDSPTILKVVSSILARHGYEPTVAPHGAAGIELIMKSARFDLVLLDFVMPRMNGYQFCRELRSSPAHRELPVVLMSAKGDKIRGQFVQQTGAVDAITKPFDARALVAVIEGALSKTSEGRARAVPQGDAMPEEDTLTDSAPRASAVRQPAHRAAVELVRQVAIAVAPAILNAPPEATASEAGVIAVVARAMTTEVLNGFAQTLKDYDHDSAREVLSGDLSAIPLAEVLQMLQLQRQTGVLRVANARTAITISVRQGLIDLVQSRGGSGEFRLGRYFVAKGIVSRDRLDDLMNARTPGASNPLLGEVLVTSKTVTQEDLTEALRRQSSELIYEILRWPHGRFWLTKEPFRPEAERAKLGLGVSGLLLEGFRRVDEWRLMEGTIDFDSVVYVDTAALETVGEEKLGRMERVVLRAVDGQRTVSGIIKESGLGSFDAVKLVYQLLESRVLRTRG